MTTFAELKPQLAELDVKLSDPDPQARSFLSRMENIHAYDLGRRAAFLAEFEALPFGRDWADYRRLMLHLADIFLAAKPRARSPIRAAFDEYRFARVEIPTLVQEQIPLIRSSEDAALLRRLFALVALLDGRVGFMRLRVVLSNLFYAAGQAGLEPEPVCREAAGLSGKEGKKFMLRFTPLDPQQMM